MTALVRARHPEAPLFLLGESMGAAVILLALQQPSFPRVDGIVLVAPAVWGWSAMHPAAAAGLRWAARFAPP
jgi:alpha-beta hydrolase superfamily lysophospholipase